MATLTQTRQSLRAPIDEKCRDCIYDPADPGGWRQQVDACSCTSCPLWKVRCRSRAAS
jgi:hypothetical protein